MGDAAADRNLTERQRKWFASVRANMQAQTGRSLEEWVALEGLEAVAASLDAVVQSQRKGYTAWSRDVQFAAARPLRGGRALLGLKLDPSISPRLSPSARRESWSERLTAIVELDDASKVDAEIARLFAAAAENG